MSEETTVKIEIEITEDAARWLNDLVGEDYPLPVVVARAAEVGAAAFHSGTDGSDYSAAFANLTDPDGYGE